jgi:hypothetical protein
MRNPRYRVPKARRVPGTGRMGRTRSLKGLMGRRRPRYRVPKGCRVPGTGFVLAPGFTPSVGSRSSSLYVSLGMGHSQVFEGFLLQCQLPGGLAFRLRGLRACHGSPPSGGPNAAIVPPQGRRQHDGDLVSCVPFGFPALRALRLLRGSSRSVGSQPPRGALSQEVLSGLSVRGAARLRPGRGARRTRGAARHRLPGRQVLQADDLTGPPLTRPGPGLLHGNG